MDVQRFTIEIPIEALSHLEPIELPANMERLYQTYLEDEEVKNSGLYNTMVSHKKYAGIIAMIGEVLVQMFEGDDTFENSYYDLKEYLAENLKELDGMFTDMYPKETIETFFSSIFHSIIKVGSFEDKEKYEHYEKVASIGMNIDNPKFIDILDGYGLGKVVQEIILDEHVMECIEKNYLKPFKEILAEYIETFFDKDVVFEAFSEVFVQSKKAIAYQAAMQVLVNEAISKNLNISEAFASLGFDNIVAESKKVIESFAVLEEYKEEMKVIAKFIMKQTQ